MSFNSLLDNKCDIYHLKIETSGGGYGIPEQTKEYYSEEPDEVDIPCHFGKSSTINIKQENPQNSYTLERKLNLPIGTNIKSVDKVIDKSNNVEYISGIPDSIRNHHIVVMVRKKDEYL